jgi:hypothetical protein
MVDVKRDYELKEWQTGKPVLHHQVIGLPPEIRFPEEDVLNEIFPGTNHSLKTWGRAGDTKVLDPHWIGVRKPTAMHMDPSYPRYSHHLVLRCDDMWLWGLDKERVPCVRGMFYILDGHSPHQLAGEKQKRGAAAQWYVAVSYDTSDEPADPKDVIPLLLEYAKNAPLEV